MPVVGMSLARALPAWSLLGPRTLATWLLVGSVLVGLAGWEWRRRRGGRRVHNDTNAVANGRHHTCEQWLKTAAGPGGVSRFRILGIEVEAGLDPLNVTAFVTGLTFVADGQLTGTMTPLTVEVPTPAAILLVGSGLLTFAVAVRRRRR
jgi:hypothetical protein